MHMFNIEKSISFLLSKCHQRACEITRDEISDYDLTPAQFGLLVILWQQDGLTQADLAEKGQIDRTTICGLVSRLEKKELAKRQPHNHDRRACRIHLTEHGKLMAPLLSECVIRGQTNLTNDLNEREVNELIRMLNILRGLPKPVEDI